MSKRMRWQFWYCGMSTSGATNVLYKWLVYLLSLKKKADYSDMMPWLCCRA